MIGNKFETAFMSAVKGTASMKDAFRQMAIDIIAELYRIFVQRITGFITRIYFSGFPNFCRYSGEGKRWSGECKHSLHGR